MTKDVKMITDEQRKEIVALGTKGKGFRNIRDDIYEFFRIRHKMDEEGNVIEQYVPVTLDGTLSGYKLRKVPKDFLSIGEVGKVCDFVGANNFKSHSNTLLLVGGEVDMCSAFQILKDFQDKKGNNQYDYTAVVCSTIGEAGVASQLKVERNYEFVNRFKKIILCLDADDAGREAAEKALKVLPKGKTYVMTMRYKDPNEYLKKGKEQEFISDFFAAKQHIPAEIVASNNLYDEMLEYVSQERHSLPPFMKGIQDKLRGGLPVRGIVNIMSGSGTGKSTITEGIVLHAILANNQKIAVIPLENTPEEFLVNLLSTFVGTKIMYMQTAEERREFLQREDIKRAYKKLSEDEEGNPRLFIIDSDIEVDEIKEKVDYLVKACGVQMVIVDPLSDLIDKVGSENAPAIMLWQKETFKANHVLFLNVVHMRKTSSGEKAYSQGGLGSEESSHGSSTIYKSAGVNIITGRNKEAEDEVERNTTRNKVTKARGVGSTGECAPWYYDIISHRMYDYNDWCNGEFYQEYYKKFYSY